jgi:hypothetical protein
MDAQQTQKLVAAASAVVSAAPVPGLQLGLFLLQEAIQDSPAIVADIQALFSKGIPTEADWNKLHAKVADKTYRDYVPDTALPQGEGQE